MRAIHTIYTNLRVQFCRIILKAHLGTVSDYLSKIKIKKSSLNANLEVALKYLGDNVSLDDNQMQETEEYLVHVELQVVGACV